MSGKGDRRRKPLIDKEQEDLRWELCFTKDQSRKEAILERLKAISENSMLTTSHAPATHTSS